MNRVLRVSPMHSESRIWLAGCRVERPSDVTDSSDHSAYLYPATRPNIIIGSCVHVAELIP
jgi:hypothetical protein